jgi:hypothetical protein
MSERLANFLNPELAWQKVKFDRPDRIFVTNPYLIEMGICLTQVTTICSVWGMAVEEYPEIWLSWKQTSAPKRHVGLI